MRGVMLSLACAGILSAVAGCRSEPEGTVEPKVTGDKKAGQPVKVAYVTNCVADFWEYAAAGARKAASELDKVEVEVIMPEPGDVTTQRGKIETLLNRGVDGIAVSPCDAAAMNDLLNNAAGKTVLITHDSDAPKSDRLFYIGTNNFTAGEAAGRAFLEVCPEGGKVAMFVARLDAQNAIERSEGFKAATKGKVEVVKIFTDAFDRGTAKKNVLDAIQAYGDLKGLVGLYAYNGTAIASALGESGEAAKRIKVVAFDEEDATLEAVEKGLIHATVVQNPYEFGARSVKVLAALARGDKSVLPQGFPENRIVYIPERIIRQKDAAAFRTELKKLREK